MSQVDIRSATPGDVDPLAELSTQLGYPSSVEQTAGRLAPILASDDHLVLVAESVDGVVGWIHVFLALRVESGPFAEIGGFVVTETLRGQGIGRALLTAAEEWVRRRGVAKLRVRTRSTRHGAQAFYQRLGFAPTKEQQVLDKVVESRV